MSVEVDSSRLSRVVDTDIHFTRMPSADIPRLSPAERHQVLYLWNDTAVELAEAGKCVHQLFEAQAAKTPDAPALLIKNPATGQQDRLSYAELNRQSNQLAHYLRTMGAPHAE